jgi:dihydrofolate reductase
MRRLTVFDSVSLDGYFTDRRGDMSWAHKDDREWNEYVAGNAAGGGVLLFGRVTYELMAAFWPTPQARQLAPAVAEAMNEGPKVVFSRTLRAAPWTNTRLVRGDLEGEVRRLKGEDGPPLVVLGSGTIVAQLAQARLVDTYQLALNAVVLGGGRTLFEGVREPFPLTLEATRPFRNGNVVLTYAAAP